MEKGEDRDKQGFEREREGVVVEGGDRERGWRRERRRKRGGGVKHWKEIGKSLEKRGWNGFRELTPKAAVRVSN